jgi:hypothetical protein
MKQKPLSGKIFGLVGLFLLFLTFACAGPSSQTGKGRELSPESQGPPEWMSKIPAGKTELCATGVSGPTYYPEDAVVNSKTQAITELSRSIESKVKSNLTVKSHGGATGSSQEVDETIALSTEEIVRLAQVRAQWVNPGGFSQWGQKGSVYTLVCMPLSAVTR